VRLGIFGSGLHRLALDKWQLAFLAFLVIYTPLLMLDLAGTCVLWDEMPHLNGGLLLSQGRVQEYLGSTRYPPMLDLATAGYFRIFGASVYAGRLVSITFAVLTLWALFELTYRAYGPRVGLLSGVLLATMPGFVWLSRLAFLEMMLEFFFVVSILLFLSWLRTGRNWVLVLSGVALGLGLLTKYQMLAAAVVILTYIPLVYHNSLRVRLRWFPLLVVTAVLVVLPWVAVVFQIYMSGMLGQWLQLLQMTDLRSHMYSTRFPLPIFYLIEMTWPYGTVHPISLLVYAFGLLGFGVFAWRRRLEDKFLLVWFFVVYVFFTLIGIKDWRYVLPVFPVLAVSAACFLVFVYGKAETTWQSRHVSVNRKRAVRMAALCLIVLVAVAIVYSCVDAYSWVARWQIYVPIGEAASYVAERLGDNESVMVACALNMFNREMVRFYLTADASRQNQVWQYPELPVDSYTPSFNVTEINVLCREHNAKYVLVFEYGITYPYFNSTLTMQAVYEMLNQSGTFTYETSFGASPCKILILRVTD
jgi:4-amino-4-deoxy-L-arabinose transferase-like glycosyltransferase